MHFIGQLERASTSSSDIDRFFLGGLQVPVDVRILWVLLELCCGQGSKIAVSQLSHLSLRLLDLAFTYAILSFVF